VETFIYLYLLVIILVPGLAIRFGDRIEFYLILFFPLMLYLRSFFKKNILHFPHKLTSAWFGFTFFSFISVTLSHDKQLSIETFLVYQAAFLIGIFFYNDKLLLKSVINKSIFTSSLIFITAFLLKDEILQFTNIFDPNQILNFFITSTYANNHLGIWLGMSVIISIASYSLGWVVLFTPFLLISFSRSAYLGLLVVSVLDIYKRKHVANLTKYIGILLWIFVVVLAIIIIVPRANILSDRPEYYKEALMGFVDKPLFGYGLGNFTEISRKYASISNGVFGTTSHNILFDMLSGSGIFSFIFFVLFLKIFYSSHEDNLYFKLAIFLFICFNASYIFAMPVLLVLFFVYIGLSYRENRFFRSRYLAIVGAIFLAFVSVYLGYSEALFLIKNYSKSIAVFPYRKQVYESLVVQTPIQDVNEINHLLNTYKRNFPDLFETYNFSGYYYKIAEEYEHALRDYLVIFENGTGFNPTIAYEIQLLYLKLNKPVKAYEFSKMFISRILNNPNKYRHMFNSTYDFCIKTNKFFLDKAACF